jgi:5-oxoprolinase (ATP-hydrolysing)
MVQQPAAASSFGAAFEAQHLREFGFSLSSRAIAIDDIRVRGTGRAPQPEPRPPPVATGPPVPIGSGQTYFEGGWAETPSYGLGDLRPGHVLHGPALLLDDISTVVVEPGCVATVTPRGHLEIDVGSADATPGEPPAKRPRSGVAGETAWAGARARAEAPAGGAVDPIRLSVYSHRFMGIAEQMGRTLQRTSVSTNIKERLDFSCAIFDAHGGLVANAPHIPVHLGAMQDAVRVQQARWAGDIWPGDVFVSNHPQLAGGSHLPDITVITPAFAAEGGTQPAFWVASRGHHADIGGSTPGSMPPFSHSLDEEGAQIVGYKLVDKGRFMEEGIRQILKKSRNLADNVSDLKAQVRGL